MTILKALSAFLLSTLRINIDKILTAEGDVLEATDVAFAYHFCLRLTHAVMHAALIIRW